MELCASIIYDVMGMVQQEAVSFFSIMAKKMITVPAIPYSFMSDVIVR